MQPLFEKKRKSSYTTTILFFVPDTFKVTNSINTEEFGWALWACYLLLRLVSG